MMSKSVYVANIVAKLLVIVGALVWLGVGAFDMNVVTKFLPAQYAKYVFMIVGIAGVFLVCEMAMLLFVKAPVKVEEKMGNVFGDVAAKKETDELKMIFDAKKHELGHMFSKDSIMAHAH